MTYIMTPTGHDIINSDFVERFRLVEKPDAALIVASYGDTRPPVTLSRYKDEKEAASAMGELLSALAANQPCYTLPDSLLYYEERIKKDARTKRKGGS